MGNQTTKLRNIRSNSNRKPSVKGKNMLKLQSYSEPPMTLKRLKSISAIQSQKSAPPMKSTMNLVSKNTINKRSFEIKAKKLRNKRKSISFKNILQSNPNIPSHTSRNSVDFSKINNGVTGVYISSKVAKLAGIFWDENIAKLERYDQLEIGCAIYFRMITESTKLRNKIKKEKIEVTGLRFVEMLTWLLQAVTRQDINLFNTLTKLGVLHEQLGINKNDFELLINSVHETMEEYFPNKYEIDIKYSMEQCLTVCMQIMMGEYKLLININERQPSYINYSTQFNKLQLIKSGGFLKSYDICVSSDIGREYLYRYLGQTWCSEVVVFLQLLHKYDKQDNDKGKFIVARDIQKKCLTHGCTFEINVSFDCYQNFQEDMIQLEDEFKNKGESFVMEHDIMAKTRREIKKLIVRERWKDFVQTFNSFDVFKA